MVEFLLWLQVEVREVCMCFANVNRDISDVSWMDSRITSQSKKEICCSLRTQNTELGQGKNLCVNSCFWIVAFKALTYALWNTFR